MTADTAILQVARDALAELVRLQKLAQDADKLNCSGSGDNVRKQREWRDECRVKLPLAYEAARDAIAVVDTALAVAPSGPPVRYGCHGDLNPDTEPDGCVIDTGKFEDCVHAFKGAKKESCSYWRPIVLVPARG